MAADKAVQLAVKGESKEAKSALAKGGTSYAFELAECSRGIAFAFGGVYPGTLHAHGALVKTHQVSYSIGAAGKYLLHIGLRQQSTPRSHI